jgi:hypothetical protein
VSTSVALPWNRPLAAAHFDLCRLKVCSPGSHKGFDMQVFGARPEIADVWGLGGPEGSKDPSKRWGVKPLTSWEGLPAPRGCQDFKIRRFPAGPKTMC